MVGPIVLTHVIPEEAKREKVTLSSQGILSGS